MCQILNVSLAGGLFKENIWQALFRKTFQAIKLLFRHNGGFLWPNAWNATEEEPLRESKRRQILQ